MIAFPIETVLEKWFQLTSVLNIDSFPIILWGLVVAPILEELVFRAGLRNARYCLFAGPPLMLMFCRAEWQVLLGLTAVIILIAAGSAWYDGQKDKRGLTGYRFARARRFLGLYPWIFWLFTISFALVHASNFVSSDRMGLIPFFAVSSQLVAGVGFGYLRLRDGLKSAIALHFANNLVALTLSVLLG
ncbi:MAG: CPBP family intramembrane metalloprotease [Herminiimonas sp.]|nr:CPBP family intramembrane metalloprotease [Herminiimonas sp.]